jgi:integrase
MKTEHLVPLSRQSLAILPELRTIAGSSRFVFPGRNSNKPISNNTMLFALYRLGYKVKMTGHGFHAVASTILSETGHFKPDVMERQLAHCGRNEVRGAYNRAVYLPERKRMIPCCRVTEVHLPYGHRCAAGHHRSGQRHHAS